jgi:hypothetical protein
MQTIRKSAHVGPDGILRVEAPVEHRDTDVQVVLIVEPASSAGGGDGDWWQRLQTARAELQRRGHRFRAKDEIDAEMTELRADRENP